MNEIGNGHLFKPVSVTFPVLRIGVGDKQKGYSLDRKMEVPNSTYTYCKYINPYSPIESLSPEELLYLIDMNESAHSAVKALREYAGTIGGDRGDWMFKTEAEYKTYLLHRNYILS